MAADPMLNFGDDAWESLGVDLDSDLLHHMQLESDWFKCELPSSDYFDLSDDMDKDWTILGNVADDLSQDNIMNSDCMWPGNIELINTNTFVPLDLIPTSPGQSLLRPIKQPRPDTPPSLDGDEPPEFRHAVDVAGTARRLLRDSAAVAADHSYTLARQNFDGLGVQTPSDSGESEEEIDVVSVGTSQQSFPSPTYVRNDTLPRVPSVKERHSIQKSVASAMAPRPAGRKRLVPPSPSAAVPRRRGRGPGRRGRKSTTDTETELDSPEIERRSIHNDMERLRRIGLKNLFDELKQQIPATKDKERAPKVVILREAAALCRRLAERNEIRNELLERNEKLKARRDKLRKIISSRLRARRH